MNKVALTFDTDIAKDYGVNAAIILQNIEFWQHKNEANQCNFIEGRCWVYNSSTAWARLFTFLSEKQIRTAIYKLEKSEILVSGVFNKHKRDRTKWYSSTRICSIDLKGNLQLAKTESAGNQIETSEVTISADGTSQKGRPLPVINTVINKPVINKEKSVFNFRKELINLGLKEELASDWLKVRKNKKATNTETAFKRFVKEFEKSELGINEIVEICIVKSWAGFENKWPLNAQKQNNQPKKEVKLTAAEALKKELGM
ncbi:hypothetical protein [Tenacibaculum finnmarkense]|uniref:hypothetical protein n=1 Tax=Tenacibaculum finnmarkense TaxID=2781243 RepID=UPI00207A32CB|nr:hypothetical protein [Tenacibaculum finnmarkense]MCM8906806.1 hypothetical protein [Tenacibaculum finnmarkense genomovar finnmarkense]